MNPANVYLKARKSSTARALLYFAGVALFAVAGVGVQVAFAVENAGVDGIDASGSYPSEMRACAAGSSQQDRVTCMKEARNVLADKKHGRQDTAGGDFESNATARCGAFAGAEAAACRARVMGFGSSTGSVRGGGMLREVETVVAPSEGEAFEVDAKTPNPVVLFPTR